jgi:hypothetical protein
MASTSAGSTPTSKSARTCTAKGKGAFQWRAVAIAAIRTCLWLSEQSARWSLTVLFDSQSPGA